MDIVEKSAQALGTTIEVKLPSASAHLFSFCFSEFSRIEAVFSRFLDSSELSRLNADLGIWQDASEEMISLLISAENFRKCTDGNFDITLKSALDFLGYDKDYTFREKSGGAKMPSANSVVSSLFGAISIDQKNRRVLLRKEIDFGGFGKGYALDCVAKMLEARGARHYYLNAGGDIYAKRGEGFPPWEILLEHPDDPEIAIGKIELDGKSIAASAPNRRKWGGSHHLLDAKTGKSAQGMKAVFVSAKTGIEADAYATALFSAGFESAIALSKKLPFQALMVSPSNKMFVSQDFGATLFG